MKIIAAIPCLDRYKDNFIRALKEAVDGQKITVEDWCDGNYEDKRENINKDNTDNVNGTDNTANDANTVNMANTINTANTGNADSAENNDHIINNESVTLVFLRPDQLCREWIVDADAVIGNTGTAMIEGLERLKWLQVTNAGVEGYTSSNVFPKQTVLTNVTGAFGGIIAEYVLAGILSSYRRLFDYKEQQKQRKWQDAGSEMQLMGKHALILGAGDIGTQTAKRLKAFDVTVTGVRRVKREKPDFFDQIITLEEIDHVLPLADLVIGCMPKTPETFHILNEKRIGMMKESALFVNVGRGALADTDALVRALKEKRIAGAVLDVFEQEPLPENHELWELEQVVMTPHISGLSFGHSKDVEEIIIRICCENLKHFIKKEPFVNRVDFESGYAYHQNRGADKTEE